MDQEFIMVGPKQDEKKANLSSLAPPYDNAATYDIDDYCTYNGKLYKCISAISTAEAFTIAHWSEKTVDDELNSIQSSLTLQSQDIANRAKKIELLSTDTTAALIYAKINKLADRETASISIDGEAIKALTWNKLQYYSFGSITKINSSEFRFNLMYYVDNVVVLILSGISSSSIGTCSFDKLVDDINNTQNAVGIVCNGNKCVLSATIGQYIILKNSTIVDSGTTMISDGLYTAAKAINANTVIDKSYLTRVYRGGLNALNDKLIKKASTTYVHSGAISAGASGYFRFPAPSAAVGKTIYGVTVGTGHPGTGVQLSPARYQATENMDVTYYAPNAISNGYCDLYIDVLYV